MWQNFHKISLSLLVIFLALSVFLWPSKWALIFNKNSNDKINELQELNKQYEDDKKLLNERYIVLSDKYKLDSLKLDSLKIKISMIDSSITKVDGTISVSRKELDRLKKEQKDAKKAIDMIKNTPNNKTGEELIYSIDQKLKKIK